MMEDLYDTAFKQQRSLTFDKVIGILSEYVKSHPASLLLSPHEISTQSMEQNAKRESFSLFLQSISHLKSGAPDNGMGLMTTAAAKASLRSSSLAASIGVKPPEFEQIYFAIDYKNRICSKAAVLVVTTAILPLGVKYVDEEKLQARLSYLGIKGAGSIVLRFRCMHYTTKQITNLPGTYTTGSVNSQLYLIKQLIGEFSPDQLIDICTCSNEDYNINYYKLIEDFKRINDCTYKKQQPLS